MKPIATPAEFITCLGGPRVVAVECDVPLSDIDRWIREDAVPRGLHMRLFARAIIAGRTFDAKAMQRLFGLSAEDAAAFCQALTIIVPHFQPLESCSQ